MKISLGRRHVVIVPGSSSATNFDITKVQSWNIPLGSASGTFTVGEAVTQASSGAEGVVFAWEPQHTTLTLVDMVGTFDTTNTLTGNLSSATGIPATVHYAFPNGIRLSAIAFRGGSNDILVVRDTTINGKPIFSSKDTTGGGVRENIDGRKLRQKVYINWAECTLTAPAWVRLEYD